MTIVVASDR